MADIQSRAGRRYESRELLDYVNQLHAPHDAALAQAFAAPGQHEMPAIQLGPSEGKLVGLLIALTGARKVVEVGTLAGYSAIYIARALPEDGRLWSIESEPRYAEVARASLAAAGLSDRAEVLTGVAAQVLPTLVAQAPFDAVFLDADKASYALYGEWAAQHLRRGGILLADNAYLFGRLLEDSDEARAVRRFHEQVARDFDSVCIPTPDGLVLGVKRSR
jgi:caffeoyl-CoA O-methyltransferase